MNLRKFAEAANILNTINGGMVSPLVDFSKEKNHYLLKVSLPGVHENNVRVEISQLRLMIYHLVPQAAGQKGKNITNIIETLPLPVEVDFKKISATFRAKELHVVLPFNELLDGNRQEIEIFH